MADLKRTAFDEVQREAGASWTDWEGWAWAADFGDAVGEHLATRNAANMWDESPLRKWDIRGRDALALADAAFTNDMSSLAIGWVRYGAICDEQGKMIMDGTVFRHGRTTTASRSPATDSDLDWFRTVAADRSLEVEVEDRTPQMPHLQVQGPQAREVLGTITDGADLEALRYFRFLTEPVAVGGVACWISAYPAHWEKLGFELYRCAGGRLGFVACTPCCARPVRLHMIRPIGLSAIETLRIECGAAVHRTSTTSRTRPIRSRVARLPERRQAGQAGRFPHRERDALRAIAAEGTPAACSRRCASTARRYWSTQRRGHPRGSRGRHRSAAPARARRSTWRSSQWRQSTVSSRSAVSASRLPWAPPASKRVGGAVSALRHREAPAAILAGAAGDRTGATACGGRNEPFEDAREALVDAPLLLKLPLHGEHFAAGELERLGRSILRPRDNSQASAGAGQSPGGGRSSPRRAHSRARARGCCRGRSRSHDAGAPGPARPRPRPTRPASMPPTRGRRGVRGRRSTRLVDPGSTCRRARRSASARRGTSRAPAVRGRSLRAPAQARTRHAAARSPRAARWAPVRSGPARCRARGRGRHRRACRAGPPRPVEVAAA